jgi:hypothetical protein
MYGFILGFQRLVWWPKWTPASKSCFIVTTVFGQDLGFDRMGFGQVGIKCQRPFG